MSPRAALAFFVFCVSPAAADTVSYQDVSKISCRGYIELHETALWGAIADPVADFIMQNAKGKDHLSFCVADNYVFELCKLDPRRTIKDVVAEVLRRRAKNMPLPNRMCGA